MSTETSQRVSPPPSTKPVKPRKFRSSCDACSASKVKCDQGQPQCLRCINLGMHCNYSPSRRMGKPPASSRKLTTTSNPSSSESEQKEPRPAKKRQLSPPTFLPDLPVVDPSNLQVSLDSSYTDDFMTMNWQDDIFQTTMFDGPATADIDLTAANLFDLSFDFMADGSPPMPHSNQFIFGDDSLNSSKAPSRNPTYENLQLFASPQSSSHSTREISPCTSIPKQKSMLPPPAPEKKLDTPPQSPLSKKLSLLTSTTKCNHQMDFGRTELPSPCPGSNASIDQVLIKNKTAIENAYNLLACSCSNDPHFALTLALICNKILGMYEAVIKTSGLTSESPTTRMLRPSNSGPSIPITVGAYQMDAEDEERIRIQIVVNELRKVKGLVDRYASKYCNSVGGTGEGIYSALEGFLRSKLTTTLQELLTRLEC